MQVRGDAFLARIFDDGGDGFDRQDLLVSGELMLPILLKGAWPENRNPDYADDADKSRAAEVSSTAQWVRDAAAQNRRKQASAKPEQLETLLQLRTGDSASQPQRHPQQHSDQSLPPPPPASPAEQAKAAGNRAFAAGDYQEASGFAHSVAREPGWITVCTVTVLVMSSTSPNPWAGAAAVQQSAGGRPTARGCTEQPRTSAPEAAAV